MSAGAKNVVLFGRRTSIRFTEQEWAALQDICAAESMSYSDFCERAILQFAGAYSSKSARVKTAIIAYLHDAWRADEFIIVDGRAEN